LPAGLVQHRGPSVRTTRRSGTGTTGARWSTGRSNSCTNGTSGCGPARMAPAEAATPFAVLQATLAAVHDRPGIRHW